MANAGVPVEVRQKFTGHASAEMNAHSTHHEIETLRSAIGDVATLKPPPQQHALVTSAATIVSALTR